MAVFNSLAKIGKLESIEHYLPEDPDAPEARDEELTDEASELLLQLLVKHGPIGS